MSVVAKCPACQAVVNIKWPTCLNCHSALNGIEAENAAPLPKFADGDHVCLDRWTETVTGTVDGAPWLEDRAGLMAGFWYMVRLRDGSYTYVHESRLTHVGKASR